MTAEGILIQVMFGGLELKNRGQQTRATGQVQLAAHFCMACELRIVFTFLND